MEDYRMTHRPSAGCPLNDLTANGVYPANVYSRDAARFYGSGSDAPEMMFRICQAYRNKPDTKITIYRAVPKDIDVINPGDWVAINKEYAIEHGHRCMGGKFKVIRKSVKASEIFTNGDSIEEWGYFPVAA